MELINYITNINVEEASGGWSGMNYHVCRQLGRNFSLNIVDSINPAYSSYERIVSKLKRTIHLPGSYPAFTGKRLNQIATLVDAKLNQHAILNFFHGATSWTSVQSTVPYALYLDACFGTYIDVYHDKSKFNAAQLEAIYRKEILFLAHAKAVFFSSEWSLQDTKKRYKIGGSNFIVAGLGGYLSGSSTMVNDIDPYFLFVGLDFIGKGGDKVVAAFKKVKEQHPAYKLKIVGQKPPAEYLHHPGVEYAGFFDKNKKSEFEQLTSLFSGATGFVLPTSKDMTPLVIIEANSVGCPVISINNFGIPEMVKHMETGILLQPDQNIEAELAKAMLLLSNNKNLRQKLSVNARNFAALNFNWARTGDIICKALV